jgi:hypothetical protein
MMNAIWQVARNAGFFRKCFSEPLSSNPCIKDLRSLRKKHLSKSGGTNRSNSLSLMVHGLTLSDLQRQGAEMDHVGERCYLEGRRRRGKVSLAA